MISVDFPSLSTLLRSLYLSPGLIHNLVWEPTQPGPPFRQDYGAPGGWAVKTSFYLYFSPIFHSVKFFVLKSQAASRAQIDTSSLHKFLETREK
jgi:hypothetical protein